MTSRMARLVALVLGVLALGGTARADFFVGNPSSSGAKADSWTAAGNSHVLGEYIRGSAGFNFDMYRTEYSVKKNDALTKMASAWTVGDTVFGMGGVIANPGDNANLTGSVRIVSKYAAAVAPGFMASTTLTPPGDGLGNFAVGDGGVGSVLISTAIGAITQGGAGALTTPQFRFQQVSPFGTDGTVLAATVARFAYTVELVGSNYLLKSWEVLLNVSLLPNVGGSPSYNVDWDQALQRGTKSFTDGLNTGPVPPPAGRFRRSSVPSDFENDGGQDTVATPLPPTMVAFAAGAAVLGFGRVLRRRVGA